MAGRTMLSHALDEKRCGDELGWNDRTQGQKLLTPRIFPQPEGIEASVQSV